MKAACQEPTYYSRIFFKARSRVEREERPTYALRMIMYWFTANLVERLTWSYDVARNMAEKYMVIDLC